MDGSNKRYRTLSYVDQGNVKNSFFERIHENEKFKLFLKERIKYTNEKPAKSSYEQAVSAKFIRGKNIFYTSGFKTKSAELVEIPKKRKNLFKIFKGRSKSVEKYIKKEKLKLEKKDDLIKIMNFYFNED